MMKVFTLIISILIFSGSLADSFSSSANYEVCFTPGGDCTGKIVKAIDLAKKEVLVQAYSFTSYPIASALIRAKRRNVNVYVILDKSQEKQTYLSTCTLVKHGIKVWIDTKPAIAHNKIIVVDKQQVITGSFNFTNAAQKRNAENVIVIHDLGVAKQYSNNWNRRLQESTLIDCAGQQEKYKDNTELTFNSKIVERLINEIFELIKQIIKHIFKGD